MNKILWGLLLCLFSAAIISLFVLVNSSKKIVYVNTMEVYNQFSAKRELEERYRMGQIVKQTYLDSIKLSIQTLIQVNKRDNDEKINHLRKIYLLKEDQFQRENESTSRDFNEQIWKQINQYVEDFAKDRGYDFILGASGQGSLMYANDKDNLTKEVIEYINKRYDGKKQS